MLKAFISFVSILLTLSLVCIVPGIVKAEASLIPDTNLEAAIRMELSLLQKPLEKDDLLRLKSLYPKDPSQKVNSLEGLQYATNLTSLFLPQHGIKGLEPLQNLSKLNFLALNGNQIISIEPLGNHTNIARLVLSGNQIESLKPLSNLNKLTDLLISNNRITDISTLSGLPLRWLDLSGNQVEDLSPLIKVPSLETLYIGNNHIHNVDALLQLTNLKDVHIEDNPLDEHASSVLQLLKEKGVKIESNKVEAPSEVPSNASKNDIRVILDADTVSFSVPPFIANSTTLVQFRPIFKQMGLEIAWDEQTRTVTGRKQGVQIELQIDNPIAKVNGKSIALSVAPTLKEGNTFVPLRFISESVEAKVEWEQASRTAIIYSKNEYTTNDSKFHFTAYGLWRHMAGQNEIEAEVDESVQEFASMENAANIQLAIKYFNYTMLFISAEPKKDETKGITLAQYVDRAKKNATITSDIIIEEKQAKLFEHDALQLTYVNNSDWDKRIDTLLVFMTDTHIYTIRNSSYEVTYKSSTQDFVKLLESMSFHEK